MDFKDDLSVKSDDTCSSFDNLTDANEVEEKILLEFNNEDDFFYVKIENNVPPIQQDQDVESIDAYIENPLKDIDKIDLNYVLLTKSNAPLLEQHVFSSDCEDLPCELETSQISLTNFDDKIELDSTDYLIVKDDECLAENFDCMLVEEPLNLHLKSYDNNFINEIVELNNFEEALIKETLDKLNSSFVHLQKSFNPYMDNILRSFFYFDYDKCLSTIKEQETLKMIKNFENLGHVEENEEEELDAMDRHFFSSTMLLILMASCLITFSFLFFEDKSYQHKMNPTFMRASPYSQFKKYSLHSKIYGPNLLPPDFSTRNNILAYSSVTYNYYNGRLRQSSLFLSRNFTIISSNLISPEQFCESNGNRQPFIVDNQNLFLSPTPPASNKTRYLQKICESLKRKSAQRAKVWSEALNLSRGLGRLTSTTVALNRYLSHNLNKDRRRQLYGFPNLSRFVAGLRTLDDSIHLIRKIDTKIAELQPFCRIRKKNNLEYFLHTSAGLLEYLPPSIRVVNRDPKCLEPPLLPAISLTRLHALTTVSGQTYLNQRNGPIKNTKRSTSNLVENDIFPVKRDPFSKIDHPIYDGNYTRKHMKNWSCCLRYKSLTNRTLPIPIFSITKQHSMASTTTLGLKLSSVNGTFSLPKLTSCFEKILQIPLNNYISFQPKIKSFIPTFSSVLTSIKHGRNINHPYNTANETYKPVTYSKDEIIISPLMRRIDLNTADVSDIFTGNESLEKDTNAALSLRFCKTFNQTLTDYLLYNYEKDDFSIDFTFSDNNHNNLYYMRICQRELLQLRQKFGKNTSSPFAKNKIQLVTMNPVMHQRKPLLTAGAVSAATVGIEKYGYPNIVKQTIFPSQYYSLLQRLPNNRRNHHHLVTTNSQDVLFFSDTLKQAWPRNLDEFVILLGELDAFARTIDAFAKEYSRRLDKRFHYMIDNTVARKPIQETLSPFSLEKRAFVTDWMRDMEGFKGLRRLRKDVNRTLRVLRGEYRAALFEPSLDSVFFLSKQKLIIPKHHPSLDFIKVDSIRTNKVAPSTQRLPFKNKYFYENNCKIIRENRRKHGKFMDKTKLLPIMNRNSSHLSKSNDNHLPKERMDLKEEFGHEYRAENHVCNKTGCYHVTHEEESIIHPAVFGSDKSIVVATTHSLSSFIHKHDLQSLKISQKTFEKGEKAKTISVDVSTSLSGRESVVLTKTLSFGPIPPPYDVNINNTL